jgi:hypothetical protein
MQSLPAPHPFVLLTSKYSPQNFLKHPQSMFLLCLRDQVSHPYSKICDWWYSCLSYASTLSTMSWRRIGRLQVVSNILNLGTRLRWALSFTARSLYPRGKEPPVPIGQDAGWAPESVPTRRRKGKKIPAPAKNGIPVIQLVSQSLNWLRYRGSSCPLTVM